MPINTGPSRSFARGRRRGRSPRRFAPNNPITPPTNQFQRDDSTPIQAQAPGLQPATGTTPAAGSSTSAGTVNTNPSGMATTPGTMVNASMPSTMSSTPIQGQTGIQAPGAQIDQSRSAPTQPPMNQVGPNTPMQAELPAADAGVNTNPSPSANMYQSTNRINSAAPDPMKAGLDWARQRGKASTQNFGGHTIHYNPDADPENTAYIGAMKNKYGADNPYMQSVGQKKSLFGQPQGYQFGGPGW